MRNPWWRRWRTWLAVIAVALLARSMCGGERRARPVRLGTFNIENYPQDARQVRGAFDAIGELDVAAIGVQEITDPAHFLTAARRHLGARWSFVHSRHRGEQKVGVLYDSERLELLGLWVHDETVVTPNAKPALEARLRRRDTGEVFRLLVVHLKAGGDSFEVRERQLAGIERIMKMPRSDEALIVLGDFNATGEADRSRIATLASSSDAQWASEDLECTSYWNRNDGCIGTPLDHVVSTRRIKRISARGPCANEGCQRRDRCPTFHRQVSDHCPVLLELPAQ